MDGYTDGWMDKWTNGQADEWLDGWMNEGDLLLLLILSVPNPALVDV